MRDAIPPLPNTRSWRGAQLKHRDDLPVLYLYLSTESVKVKVKFSLCLTKHHATKAYWRSGGIASRILDLGTKWR
jgi:hypothetical protein